MVIWSNSPWGGGVACEWRLKKGEQIISTRLKSDAIFGNSLQKVVTELTPLLESKTIANGRKKAK